MKEYLDSKLATSPITIKKTREMLLSVTVHTCYAARPEAIPDGERDVILCADVQNLVPVGVRKVLRVIQQTQLQPQAH